MYAGPIDITRSKLDGESRVRWLGRVRQLLVPVLAVALILVGALLGLIQY